MTENETLAADIAQMRAGKLKGVLLTLGKLDEGKALAVSVEDRAGVPTMIAHVLGWPKDSGMGLPFPITDTAGFSFALAVAARVLPHAEVPPEGEALALSEALPYRTLLSEAGGVTWVMVADLERVAAGEPALLSVPATSVVAVAETLAAAERKLASSGMVDGLDAGVAH
jgi:hypothetical protein